MRDIFSSPRDFSTFEYRVSHSHLHIRSQARGEYRKNVDVVFIGVDYMQLYTHFKGLAIRECRPADAPTLAAPGQALLRPRTSHKLFELVSGGTSHYVIAGSVWVLENELPPTKRCLTNDGSLSGTEIASSMHKPFFAKLFGG